MGEMKILIVGVGFMGSLHARIVHGSRRATLCGVVDRSETVAEAVGKEFDVPAFTDLGRAIEETRPDAAIIATPDPAHREPVETAIDAGVPVLVEKPLATTLEDAEAIVRLAQGRGVRLMTGHSTRFYPRYIQVAEKVWSGELGEPVMVTASTWGPLSVGKRVSSTTTPLWHFAIHDIDLIQWITGGLIDEVDGAQLVESASSGVSVFAATGSLTTGNCFSLVTGWTLPDSAHPRWDLKVHCQRGMVQASWSSDGVTSYTDDGVQEGDCLAWPTLYGRIEGSLRREVEHFIGAIMDGTPFLIAPEEAVNAVRGAVLLDTACVRRKAR